MRTPACTLLSFFLLAACGGKTAPSVPASAPSVAPSAIAAAPHIPVAAKHEDFLAPFLETAAASRGLQPLLPIRGERVDRARMLAVVRAHVDEEVPAEDIAREEVELALYGLIPPDYLYKEGFFKLLESELAGVYIPTDKKLYYSSDLGGGESETIVHELTHALQDQHFHLGDRMKALKENDDAGFGMQVLAEGDATFTGLHAEIAKRLGPNAPAFPVAQLRTLMEQGVAESMRKVDAPPAMKRMLAAPYIEGVAFVGALYEEGGWDSVNQAWARPPANSRQALSVAAWKAQLPYSTLTPALPPQGFKQSHAAASGMYGVRALWEQWLPTQATILSETTTGDIDALYTDEKGSFAALSRIAFPAPNPLDKLKKRSGWTPNATVLYSQAMAALRQQKGWESKGDFSCLERPGVGPFALTLRQNEVLVSAGPARKQGSMWSSAATCADAHNWHAAVPKS